VALLGRGQSVVVADDHSNSSAAALDAVRRVSGGGLTAHRLDLRDQQAMEQVFTENQIDAVIHFAARKSVRESVRMPLEYYESNVGCTISLLQAMLRYHVQRLVFSSSCSIYGGRYRRPISEDDEAAPANPYARSKLMCEQILADSCRRYPSLSVISLRYFNPIGAHPGGALGEDPKGVPGNVLPYIMQVAAGKLERLDVYGSNYDTVDGSGVRDYIHVMDVAEAHCIALEHLDGEAGMSAFNLGTGHGVSVLQLLAMVEEVSGMTIPYRITARKPGDVGALISDPGRVQKMWGWQATRDLRDMCRDAWRFQRLHSYGY